MVRVMKSGRGRTSVPRGPLISLGGSKSIAQGGRAGVGGGGTVSGGWASEGAGCSEEGQLL